MGQKRNPKATFRTRHPLSHDGGKAIWHQYEGPLGKTAIKKGSPERVKELLGILNYLAAPFGTQEYHLINYGPKDVDHTMDAQGNPVLTQKGLTDLNINAAWQFMAVPMPVL